ncbi:hypothetical protein [Luteimonas sp. MC1750]|uniref:hypothetical protein n=1 Tax=Luteimonas sp. MC1750 TaxID=2799326 RepID=UPI0018F0D5A4|nr:hypothetical protein [Luteimonas sp. MC1750]MBJ6985301.1 hypothetical protein [Luteimonas sp. MC1750]QQO05434.1 hypothetical protein JGR68_11420 [Luteimonas sp. MC1750]
MVIVGLLFFSYLVYRSRDAFQDAISTTSTQAFATSIFALVLANVFVAVLFATMLGRPEGDAGSQRRMAGVFLFTQLGKYVPGRVWGMVAQASIIRAESPARLVLVNVELAVIVLFTTCGIGAALLLAHWYGTTIGLGALLLAFAVTASTLQRSWVFNLLNFAIVRLPLPKKLAAVRDVGLPVSRVGITLALQLAGFWAMYLIGWWQLASTLPGVAEVGTGLVVACLSLSYVAGLASMLPAGLGAREAVLLLLGPSSGVPFELMALLAVTSRIALLLVDGIGAGVGFLALRTSEGNKSA